MKFIDEVKIIITAGKGGNGASSFRREKFVPFGGPDGGHGGEGGSVYFIADENINTLSKFRGRKNYDAKNGENGSGRDACGKGGDDIYVKIPVGTLVRDADTGDILADLYHHEMTFLAAKGGRGGFGNAYFKTSTNQAPRYAQKGDIGETKNIHLELKLLADIGLVGFPNAGKSTLISSISEAKPKIADYPFTTLVPNLGVVGVNKGTDDEYSFVVADIPGIIENAAEGKGLGIQFLKHIERTKAIIHLIDCSMLVDTFEALDHYITIREELEKFSSKITLKKEIVCLTKIDALSDEEITRFQEFMEENLQRKVLPISSVSGKNIDKLLHLMKKILVDTQREKEQQND